MLRALFINGLVLYFVILIYPGLSFSGSLKTLFFAALALTLLNQFIKPVTKLLLLPINLITLNLFAWVANVVMLFLVTVLVSGFSVRAWHFGGYASSGFVIPSLDISQIISLILASLLISAIASVIGWLLKN